MCDDGAVSSTGTRLARPLERPDAPRVWWRALVGAAMLAVAVVLLLGRTNELHLPPWLVPVIVLVAGLTLAWSPLDAVVAADARRPDVVALVSREAWVRILLGACVSAFAVWLFARSGFTDSRAVRMWAVGGAIVLTAVMLLAPWWLRLLRQVSVERERRVREFERAEIAAHLHDSVLQTLTLIRAKADDPDAVARLARAQERDLRSYLYQERRSPADSVATALAAAMSEVEDTHGVSIDVVSVGDAPTSEALRAAVGAAREAATNAARHGVGPISVYAELTSGRYQVFVRDGGPGFDPTAVPPDRLGIRNSIIGRVRRQGGDAEVHSATGTRTEVAISVAREEDR